MTAHYLVTGGCGFIGSHLVDALVAEGHAVRVIDNLSTGVRNHLPRAAELVAGDLRNLEIVRAAAADVDGCFHLAAVASVVRCNETWHDSHLVNLAATVAVLEVAARARLPVVYASSAAVYGDNPNVLLHEEEPLRPFSAYGVDKAACEMHAHAGAAVHGLASIGLRFFNVYGPRQRPGDPYSGVISVFLDRLRRGLPPVLHGDGGQSRDFIFVADVVAALRLAMARLEREPGRQWQPCAEVYNVCTGRAVTVAELARLVMALTGRGESSVERAPSRPGDIRHSIGSPERATRELGFTATVAIKNGLERLVAGVAGSPLLKGDPPPPAARAAIQHALRSTSTCGGSTGTCK
jgi:UDP-glucose 4-epimerase